MTVQSPETRQRRTIRSRPRSCPAAPPKPPALRAVLRASQCSACGLAGRRARFRSRRPSSINVIELRSRACLRRRAVARPPSAATAVMTARRSALRANGRDGNCARTATASTNASDGTTASVTAGSLRLNAAHCRCPQCRCQCSFPPTRPSALPRTPLRLPAVTTTAPRDPEQRPNPRDRPSWIRRSRSIPATASVYRSYIGRVSPALRRNARGTGRPGRAPSKESRSARQCRPRRAPRASACQTGEASP